MKPSGHQDPDDVECAFCGRKGGQIRRGVSVCETCRRSLGAGTQLAFAVEALGLELAELAELAGVSRPTLSRALRGEPVSKRCARAIARATSVPVRVLRAGEPLPEDLRE